MYTARDHKEKTAVRTNCICAAGWAQCCSRCLALHSRPRTSTSASSIGSSRSPVTSSRLVMTLGGPTWRADGVGGVEGGCEGMGWAKMGNRNSADGGAEVATA